MNNNDKAIMYRWISIILLVMVVALILLWYGTRNELANVTERLDGDLSFYRQEIVEKCTFTATTTAAQKRECEDVLEGFSDMLRDYRSVLESAPTSTVPTSSTPTSSTPTTSTTSGQ